MSEKLEQFQKWSKVTSWITDLKDVDLIKSLLLDALRKDVDLASVIYNIAEREIEHHDRIERQILREDKLRDDLRDQD